MPYGPSSTAEKSTVHIGMVGISPVSATQTTGPLNFSSPVQQQLLNNVVQPKFTGKAQDWPQFEQDWQRYLRKVTMGAEITDTAKIGLWEGCLDETNFKFLQMRMAETDGKLTFNEEYARMQSKYARDLPTTARSKWNGVTLYNPGRVTIREWEDFEADFKCAWHNVKNASEEEAMRMLLGKILVFVFK